jgi:trimethylamine:corrinoid methyltransferase-like protein
MSNEIVGGGCQHENRTVHRECCPFCELDAYAREVARLQSAVDLAERRATEEWNHLIDAESGARAALARCREVVHRFASDLEESPATRVIGHELRNRIADASPAPQETP